MEIVWQLIQYTNNSETSKSKSKKRERKLKNEEFLLYNIITIYIASTNAFIYIVYKLNVGEISLI